MKRILVAVLIVVAVLTMAIAPAQAAIVTLDFASFGGGAVTVTFDYNENNGNVVRFTCTNNSIYNAWFGVYLVDPDTQAETLVYERTCVANDVTIQNVAGTTLAWDTVDGGLMMGNYQFRARWPAA